jgi:hypothetical protein
MSNVLEELRHAVAEHTQQHEPQFRLAIRSEIPQATLSRFINGKAGLSIESAERLASRIGLRLALNTRHPTESTQFVAPPTTTL